jgi:hypothetical protein
VWLCFILVSFNALSYSSLPFPSQLPLFKSFKYILYVLYICRCEVFQHYWVSIIQSFPSLLPWVLIAVHYCQHVLTVDVYVVMFVSLCIFTFCSIFNIENTYSLNMMSSNPIHLPSNHITSVFLMVDYNFMCLYITAY